MVTSKIMQLILKLKLCFLMQKAEVNKKKDQEKCFNEEINVYPRKHAIVFLHLYFRPPNANNSWLLRDTG